MGPTVSPLMPAGTRVALAGVDAVAVPRTAVGLEVDDGAGAGPVRQREGERERGGGELSHGHCGALGLAHARGVGEKGREGVGCCWPKRREGEEMSPSGFSYFLFPFLFPILICICLNDFKFEFECMDV